jgi:hypothetical protein
VPGKVHPRRAGAVLERDRVDHLPVITPPPAALGVRSGSNGSIVAHRGISQRHINQRSDDPKERA